MKFQNITKAFVLALSLLTSACQPIKKAGVAKKPKLVVGIVVDQMRYDYLNRYWDRYGEGGFKRLISGGFNCKNHTYNYIPTVTAAGHASVYTGTTPKYHGITGNDFYDAQLKQRVYCCTDQSQNTLGSNSGAGQMSPHRMLSTTITDQLRISSNFRSKVVGVAIKDRGAILPAGHAGNAAYWFDGGKYGNWISSTYYMEDLPQWVKDFNTEKSIDRYFENDWNTLYPIDTYVASARDDNAFEGKYRGERAPVFPHEINKLRVMNDNYSILKSTPMGNSMTLDFALAAIENEEMGQDDITDFLAVSFSSTDYIGHQFGVQSVEVEDTYLRLDQDMERMLNYLDEHIGEGQYTVFLSADHGATIPPSYLKANKIKAGYVNTKELNGNIKDFIKRNYKSDKLISSISNRQIFFDHDELARLKLDADEVAERTAAFVLRQKDVYKVYTAAQIMNNASTIGEFNLIDNGYNQKRSGDVMYRFEPNVINYSRTGSTHGSGYYDDLHVPFLLYGSGVKQGHTFEPTVISDIAATVAAILDITPPNTCKGQPVTAALQ